MIRADVRAVVLDIEGTTGSLAHVHDVLFPYARARLADWFAAHRGEQEHAALLAAVREEAGDPGLDEAGVVGTLTEWTDADVKAVPLKTVQGLIWAEGYAEGSLTGHVYPDVPEALRRWRSAGVRAHIYSSGSRAAQRDWFAFSDQGDLSDLLSGYFDLVNAGPKRRADSYRGIAGAIGEPAGRIAFLSDVAEELDAATEAGWLAVGVRRPGDPRGGSLPGHRTVSDFGLIDLRAPEPSVRGLSDIEGEVRKA